MSEAIHGFPALLCEGQVGAETAPDVWIEQSAGKDIDAFKWQSFCFILISGSKPYSIPEGAVILTCGEEGKLKQMERGSK